MALTINTNISSLVAQSNLNRATNSLNTSIERMTTGYKINHAKDNAAGYSIANTWETQLGSMDVAMSNAATGSDLLATAEETYGLLTSHLQRVRDLTEQAANGTYGSTSLKAIQSEIEARFNEITRIASNAEFNGIKLMKYDDSNTANNADVGITEAGIDLQVGLYSDTNSQINLEVELFRSATISGLFNPTVSTTPSDGSKSLAEMLKAANGNSDVTLGSGDGSDVRAFAAACTNLVYKDDAYSLQTDSAYTAKHMLKYIDSAIDDISSRVTKIGATQSRVESAISSLEVQSRNTTSSLSTLRDTDVAAESSNYLQAQILQQASATLLSTANQLPSVALNLI